MYGYDVQATVYPYIPIYTYILVGYPCATDMYEARYWRIVSAYTILNVQPGFIHVVCLGMSNKSVAVPRQDSICPYRAHAVLSGHCNIIIHTYIHTYIH